MGKVAGNQQLTSFQVAALVVVALLSITGYSLPDTVAKVAGGDGWISILLSALLSAVAIGVILALGRRCPGRDIYGINRTLLGPYLGAAINLLYTVYNLMLVVAILRIYMDMTVFASMRQTSILGLSAAFLGLAAYASLMGLLTVARICEITLFLITGLSLLLTGLIPYSRISFLLPVGSSGAAAILQGISPSMIAFIGFQLLFALLPYASKISDIGRGAAAGLAYVTVFNVGIFVAVVSYFGVRRTAILPYSSLRFSKTLVLPTVERLDVVVLIFWAAVAITSMYIYFYIAREGLLAFLGPKRQHAAAAIAFVVCLSVASLPRNPLDTEKLTSLLLPLAIAADFVIPLLLYILARLRPLKGVRP